MNNEFIEMMRSVLKEEIEPIKKDIQTIKGDVHTLKDDVHTLQDDVSTLKSEQEKTNERLTSIEAKQHIMYEQTSKLSEYHSETIKHFEKMATKEDLDYFDKKISQHEREIFKLKNRA